MQSRGFHPRLKNILGSDNRSEGGRKIGSVIGSAIIKAVCKQGNFAIPPAKLHGIRCHHCCNRHCRGRFNLAGGYDA